ncbi:MAG TPA: BON domain-containing protein [Steroidobacteraceae bacterium]|nr:BON domain-containing protein [Steroidobacteraceae bacterium]
MSLAFGCCLLLAAGCAQLPARTPQEVQADAALADRVQAALSADTMFYFRHVDAASERGVVTLTGYVGTREAKYEARKLATNAGAVRVVDLIKLYREDKRP